MTTPLTPSADPLPWVTDRLRAAGAFTRFTEEIEAGYERVVNEYGISTWQKQYNERNRLTDGAAQALLDVLTQCVSALHDDERAYQVVLNAATTTAATALEKRIVEVGSKPMNDESLTDGQKASVMAGLALHEVGHIRWARQYAAAVTRLFGAANVTNAIRALSNIAADLHDEAEACDAFPGLAPSVAVTLWWVGNKGQHDGRIASDLLFKSAAERVNLAVAATRFPWEVIWDTDEARSWLEWWTDWAQRARHAGLPKEHALLVKEGIEKVRDLSDAPQPEPEPQPGEGEDGEGEDEGDEDGEGQGQGGDEQPGQQPGQASGPSFDDETPDEGEGQGEGGQGGEGGDDATDSPTPKSDGPSKVTDTGDDPTGSTPSTDGDTDGDIGTQGGLGGVGKTPDQYEADESATAERTCAKEASKDALDAVLQSGYERLSKGKREGMRRRHYTHASSIYSQVGYGGGRTVVMLPRKGKRFIDPTGGS